MHADVHNPERTRCQTIAVQYSDQDNRHIAIIDFKCTDGGTVTMYFNTPDELRQHATAMKLLAEALEEEQTK